MPKIAIIGTTSWGTTLAVLLANKKTNVSLWARTEAEASRINPEHELFSSSKYSFPSHLSIVSSMVDALKRANAVILAVPSQSMRKNIQELKNYLKPNMLIISAAKGLERDTNKRMSEVISEEVDSILIPNICVLSGPNLAKEILLGLPASAVVAASNEMVARKAQELLRTPEFCIYTNTDIIGVELGGALKNIIALGAGMVDGLGYGDNAKAAFITRGLTEMAALGVALGASPLTLSGLAGLGDLIATCASPLSRNHYVGVELTKGRKLKEITSSMDGIAEGIDTVAAVWNLAHKYKLGMPITERLYEILYQKKNPEEVIVKIIGAAGKHELAGRRWKLFSFFGHHKS